MNLNEQIKNPKLKRINYYFNLVLMISILLLAGFFLVNNSLQFVDHTFLRHYIWGYLSFLIGLFLITIFYSYDQFSKEFSLLRSVSNRVVFPLPLSHMKKANTYEKLEKISRIAFAIGIVWILAYSGYFLFSNSITAQSYEENSINGFAWCLVSFMGWMYFSQHRDDILTGFRLQKHKYQ